MSRRLFLAVDLKNDKKELLYNIIKDIRKELKADLKWVKKDNIHITLKFLGEVQENSIDEIKKIMDNLVRDVKQQSVSTGGAAAFPHLNYPKVIYIGLIEGEEGLRNLHQRLEKELLTMGFPAERNQYTPHITIARTRRNTDIKKLAKSIIKYKENTEIESIVFSVSNISLMESTLTKNGPIYREVYKAEFN